ncbi:MAG: N-acetyltransferase [candidate division KSB1 bacterium]|nr:N-acetyltransferase [candidate division KSB1 bacterium]MDZ7305010.1 N-acetyltransferase [candidate division KSB1 bacterium]MDZ7314145.1 N-acetyltransferase [candidate division KSB1 bacterium]
MPQIEILPVTTARDLREFMLLPWKIYHGDPYWVPPLIMDLKKLFDKKKHPFFEHSEVDFFLARRNGEYVGRIAAILNNNHNKFHNERCAFFGFFESVNDQEVASALLEKAASWGRERGMTVLRGPANYSSNDMWGLLTEGFDSSPVIMMTYNPRYYVDLIESAGFVKAMELYAWWFSKEQGLNPKILRVGEKVLQEHNITIRTLNMKKFWEEVEIVKRIYNDAWSNNWGFVPMTDAEFEFMAKELKPVVNPRLVLFAEREGEPVGFSLSLPDFNLALKKINGRLLPFGIFKLLYHARRIKQLRVVTLGVVRKLQSVGGIGSALYMETFRQGAAAGFETGEFSWTLENNIPINRGMELLGARIYKRYRLYDRPL